MKRTIPLAVALLMALAAAGCGRKVTMPMAESTAGPLEQQNDGGAQQRFSVELKGVFRDTLAYGDRRGIYVIKDRESGREYVGVSGIGISELGSHTYSCGKNTTCTMPDER